MAEGGSGGDDEIPTHLNFNEIKFVKEDNRCEATLVLSNESLNGKKNRMDMKGGNKREETSLSFRQFLQENNTGARSKTKNSPDVQPSVIRPANGLKAATPDVATGLPDFVQDHIAVDVGSSSIHNTYRLNENLPDFTNGFDKNLESGSDSPVHATAYPSHSFMSPDSYPPHMLNGSSNHSSNRPVSGEAPENLTETVMIGALPDFLSDGPMASGNFEDMPSSKQFINSQSCPHFEHNNLQSEINRLRKENIILHEQLEASNSEKEEIRLRINQLESRLKFHEAGTLKLSSSNTYTDDTTIHDLRNRIKELELKNCSLKKICLEYEKLKSDANMISNQILQSSDSAEASLRTLLLGVQSLKSVSRQLQSKTLPKDEQPGPSYL